jgi:hypothetical protein
LNKNTAKTRIRKWFEDWKTELSEYKYLIIISLLFLALAEVISYYASKYVDRINVVAVPDLILDNIPTLNLDIIFSYSFMTLLLVITTYTLFFKVREFHKVAFLFSLLVFTRSIFIMLTHLGVPADARTIAHAPGLYQFFNFRNDLFFSGHAAMPFMAFLIFRKEAIGILFFILTILLSATVLLMHVHYSIDVFSAFFITFGVYTFGQWLMNKEFWHRARVRQ